MPFHSSQKSLNWGLQQDHLVRASAALSSGAVALWLAVCSFNFTGCVFYKHIQNMAVTDTFLWTKHQHPTAEL